MIKTTSPEQNAYEEVHKLVGSLEVGEALREPLRKLEDWRKSQQQRATQRTENPGTSYLRMFVLVQMHYQNRKPQHPRWRLGIWALKQALLRSFLHPESREFLEGSTRAFGEQGKGGFLEEKMQDFGAGGFASVEERVDLGTLEIYAVKNFRKPRLSAQEQRQNYLEEKLVYLRLQSLVPNL